MRSRQAVETSISVSVIALTAVRLKQIESAERNKNQHARPIPAGNIVREHQLTALIASVSKLAAGVTSPSAETLKRRLTPENLHQTPTELRQIRKVRDDCGKARKSA